MTTEEKQLIDRYLDNSLTGFELKEFLDKLEINEKFRNEVSFQNLIIEGVNNAEDKRLSMVIEKYIGYRKPLVPFALKLIFTFLFITTSGIILWNYIGPGSSGQKHNYFSLDFLNKKNKTLVIRDTTKRSVPVNKPSLKNYSSPDGIDKEEARVKPESKETENVFQTNVNEIVVKKDQFLSSKNLNVIVLEGKTYNNENDDNSITKNTVSQLNPSGDLPEEAEKQDKNYYVEFWDSPVNYKGYKLIDDKLILFGIDEPEAVMLYFLDSRLWLKYGLNYFILEQSDQFESFIPSTDIPSALK